MAKTRHDERRKNKRVPFTRKIEVVGVGMRRCLKLSSAGMYLETVQAFPVGTLLNLRVKLKDTDEHPIQV